MRLPFDPDGPRDLERHVYTVKVDDAGRGHNQEIIDRLEPDGLRCPSTDAAGISNDETLRLRWRFACVLNEALGRYQSWTTPQGGKPARLPADSVFKLAFYFNGGLNGQQDVLQTAFDSYRQIEADATYPVYMVWPTGALPTYGEDVARVRAGRQTRLSDPLTLLSIPLRPVSDLARGIAGTPAAWGTSFKEFAETSFGRGNADFSVRPDAAIRVPIAAGRPTCDPQPASDPGPASFVHPDQNLFFTDCVDEVGRRQAPGARLGRWGGYAYYTATAPVRTVSVPLLGLGEAGFRNMIRRSRTSVRAIDEFPDENAPAEKALDPARGCDQLLAARRTLLAAGDKAGLATSEHAMLQRCYPEGAGGFARFFHWLRSCQVGRPIPSTADACPIELTREQRLILGRLRITMVGHSMGTIVVNELLQLFPDLPYEALVYMAAAASVRDTARATVPVLERNRGCTKLYALMLHPMNEAREATAHGLLVSGSLLTYVDEFLDPPKTLPDRTMGQWRNLRQTRSLFPPEAQRWMLLHVYDREPSPLPMNGGPAFGVANPTTHGSFNDLNMPFWREDFWKPRYVQFPAPEARCEPIFAQPGA